jgi:hypothetical protein
LHEEVHGMAKYKRCPEAKDDACGKLGRIKRGGALHPEEPQNNFYICTSEKECKKTDDIDCKCFVLAMHVKVKDDDSESIKEEVPYLGKKPAKADDYEGLLDRQTEEEKYPGKDGKDHKKDYWKVECRCLAVDDKGKPVKD